MNNSMSKFIKTLLLLVPICFFIFLFSVDRVEAMDQRCWTEDACNGGGGSFFGPTSETAAACGMKEDASSKKIGFCLPVSQATTQVSFGGKNTFLNFGQFIKWIYEYGVIAAGGLAVLIIIVAGLQWVTSAGSPERITSAKKRIANALMGLFVAVLSFFILSAVNPYLVNLRLPQIWKINTIGLVPPYCDDVQSKKLSATKGGKFDIEPKAGLCGSNYYVEGGSEDLTCKGTFCSGRDVCLPFDVAGGKKVAPKCDNSYFTIHYKLDNSVKDYFKEGDNYIASIAETFYKKIFADIDSVEQPNWLDPNDNDMIVICANKSSAYVDEILSIDKAYNRRIVSKDANNKPLDYYEYLISYDFSIIQKANKGSYSCKIGDPVGFLVKHDLDMDVELTEWNIYVYPVEKSKRKVRIARFGGEETGMWPFSFASFKDKNYLFEVNFDSSMIENVAHKPLSSPTIGSLASENSFWEHFTWKTWAQFWGEVILN